MKKLAILLVLFSLPLLAQTKPAPPLPSNEVVSSFLRQMFGYDPTITFQIERIDMAPEGLPEVFANLHSGAQQQTLHFYVTPDGKHAIIAELLPFGADPFAEARQILSKADGPSRGPANAPLTIIEFGDLQCPSCRQAAPLVDKLMAELPNARLVFQNFPLSMHPWAYKAAGYVDCLGRSNPAAFFKFMQSVYDAQETITPENSDQKLTALVTAAGGDGPRTAACAVTPETKARIDASIELGKKAGVNGTPTLFMNGRRVTNVTAIPLDALKRIAEFQAQSSK